MGKGTTYIQFARLYLVNVARYNAIRIFTAHDALHIAEIAQVASLLSEMIYPLQLLLSTYPSHLMLH